MQKIGEIECLHIVCNPVVHDSRVLRETKTILNSGLVNGLEICGFHEPGYNAYETLDERTIRRIILTTRPLPKDLASQSIKYIEWYIRLKNLYRKAELKVIHCHDLEPLPIAVRLKKLTGARLVYDAHELAVERINIYGLRRKLAGLLEQRLISSVDALISVSPSICDWYQKRFTGTPVSLVRNIPGYPKMPVSPVPLRNYYNIPEDRLLFIYLGKLSKGRGIEKALQAFQNERVAHHIVFMGSGPLKEKVLQAGSICDRIHYHEPVSPEQVISHAAGADAGICLVEDICLNYRYCLPNKLFECLLAGLPVLASNLPDQSRIVNKYQAGWIVQHNPQDIADFLISITGGKVRELQKNLPGRVRTLCWENEEAKLIEVYKKLTGRKVD